MFVSTLLNRLLKLYHTLRISQDNFGNFLKIERRRYTNREVRVIDYIIIKFCCDIRLRSKQNLFERKKMTAKVCGQNKKARCAFLGEHTNLSHISCDVKMPKMAFIWRKARLNAALRHICVI